MVQPAVKCSAIAHAKEEDKGNIAMVVPEEQAVHAGVVTAASVSGGNLELLLRQYQLCKGKACSSDCGCACASDSAAAPDWSGALGTHARHPAPRSTNRHLLSATGVAPHLVTLTSDQFCSAATFHGSQYLQTHGATR